MHLRCQIPEPATPQLHVEREPDNALFFEAPGVRRLSRPGRPAHENDPSHAVEPTRPVDGRPTRSGSIMGSSTQLCGGLKGLTSSGDGVGPDRILAVTSSPA